MTRADIRNVTLASDTIHNPDEPRHYMKLRPIEKVVRISMDGRVLAETRRATRLIEVGSDLYDPPIYVPPEDVRTELLPLSRETVCPLKGTATYFAVPELKTDAPVAWSYRTPFGFASRLKGLIAFYADRVTVEESPK